MAENIVTLSDGHRFSFNSVNAEVITDPAKWSETHVSSSGGGGYVHPQHGGHVSAPQVSSTVLERSSYFVKTDNGREIELRDHVAARKGHVINLVYGSDNGGESHLLATVNPTTSKFVVKAQILGNSFNYFRFISCFRGCLYGKKKIIFLISLAILFFISTLIFHKGPPIVLPIGFIFISVILSPIILFFLSASERRRRLKEVNEYLVSFINNLQPKSGGLNSAPMSGCAPLEG